MQPSGEAGRKTASQQAGRRREGGEEATSRMGGSAVTMEERGFHQHILIEVYNAPPAPAGLSVSEAETQRGRAASLHERSALTALREPLDVALLEAAVQDSLVGPVEAQVVLCHLVPEGVWVLDGLPVHALVVGSVDVGLDILRQEAVGALCYFTVDVLDSQQLPCCCISVPPSNGAPTE